MTANFEVQATQFTATAIFITILQHYEIVYTLCVGGLASSPGSLADTSTLMKPREIAKL